MTRKCDGTDIELSPRRHRKVSLHYETTTVVRSVCKCASLCSDNIHTTSGEDVFEDIAKETKSAMDAQRYYAEHLQDASTIEFWLRAYVAHVAKLYAAHDAAPSSGSGDPTPAFVDTLPEYVKRYVGFVVNCLLSSPCRFVLDKFTVLFDQLSEMCPELIQPMARAL